MAESYKINDNERLYVVTLTTSSKLNLLNNLHKVTFLGNFDLEFTLGEICNLAASSVKTNTSICNAGKFIIMPFYIVFYIYVLMAESYKINDNEGLYVVPLTTSSKLNLLNNLQKVA